MKRKIFALFLCTVLVFSMSVPVIAAAPADDFVEPAASYLIADYLAFIDDLGNGSINVVYDISAKYTIEKLGVDQIELQRYINGDWEFVSAVFATHANNLVQDNKVSVLDYHNFSGLQAGGTYRAVIRFYAKNGSIVETREYTTSSVILSANP